MQLIEEYRKKVVAQLFKMPTFANCWPIWKDEIHDRTSGLSDPHAIYALGGQLKPIFASTSSGKRGQTDLSGGGAAWEGLVCWYLNLVMTNSRAIVVKRNKGLMPKILLDAMTVLYKNRRTNTESDLSGIVFPPDEKLDCNQYSVEFLEDYLNTNLNKVSLHNIQCKTNWNDNAQIPMLWDMVYQFRGIEHKNIKIGSSGKDLDDLKSFTYSFVTMPSQKKPFKAGSMPVQRVEALSGRNYWGQETQDGVALSLSEIFKQVFGNAFDGHIQGHIGNLVDNGQISLDIGD